VRQVNEYAGTRVEYDGWVRGLITSVWMGGLNTCVDRRIDHACGLDTLCIDLRVEFVTRSGIGGVDSTVAGPVGFGVLLGHQ
jgi:hypothetical protein